MLEGKKIVVTGAARGIGRAAALACAREGAVVGIGFHTGEEPASTLRGEIESRFGRAAVLLRFDVRDPAAVAQAVEKFREAQGRIDGWVNNAGAIRPGLLVAATLEDIRELVDVNLVGTITCARAVLPLMLEQRGGVIVNVGSIAAARPSRGQCVYAATKGAVEAFTRAVAVEYGRKGIRAHCVRPGPIETRMLSGARALGSEEIRGRTALRRFGLPEEAAELVAFLLSDRAAFMTGSTHDVDGGYGVA